MHTPSHRAQRPQPLYSLTQEPLWRPQPPPRLLRAALLLESASQARINTKGSQGRSREGNIQTRFYQSLSNPTKKNGIPILHSGGFDCIKITKCDLPNHPCWSAMNCGGLTCLTKEEETKGFSNSSRLRFKKRVLPIPV